MSNRPFARISMHLGEESHAECFTYDNSAPILDIRAGNASVAVSLTRNEIDEAAVNLARELARQAQLFATEVERLHAARHPDAGSSAHGTTKATDSKAA